MDRKSFLLVLLIVSLYLFYSINRFKYEKREYKAESFIDMDKKELLIEKKPPILSKVFEKYSFWGIRKEEVKKKKEKKVKKEVKIKKNLVEIKNKDGIYNICIGKRCYEILGVAKNFVVLFRRDKDKYLYFKKREGDLIEKRIKVLKVSPKEVEFMDLKSKKDLKVRYFQVKIDKYKPKEKK